MAMRRRVRLKPHSRPEAFEGAFSTDRTGGSFTGQTPGLPPTGGDELGEPSAPMIQGLREGAASSDDVAVPSSPQLSEDGSLSSFVINKDRPLSQLPVETSQTIISDPKLLERLPPPHHPAEDSKPTDDERLVVSGNPGGGEEGRLRYRSQLCLAVLLVWAMGSLGLCFLREDPKARELSLQNLEPRLQILMTTATSTQLLLQLIAYAVCNEPRRYKLALIPLTIALIMVGSAVLKHRGLTPVYMCEDGRLIWPGRYFSWAATSVLLLYLLWVTVDSTTSALFIALAGDFLMLITGFLSMAVSRGDLLFWLFASLSCASMSIVLLFKYQVFGDALRACCNLDATLYALRNVHIMTTFTWLPYPIINLLSKYDVVSHATEELLWCLFDLSTKICQASALYQGILTTTEVRNATVLENLREVMLRNSKIMKDRQRRGEMHISNVSRELRTPLNGIIGLSDALLSDPATRLEDTQLTHCLRVIRDSGARLNMLVNNLLDNATLAQRELKLSFGPVKLYNCIKDVLPLVTPLLSPAVTMVTDMPKKLPPVRGNQDRLVQVFFNIMGNAVKFCRHGTITVRGYVSEGFVKVEVVDTGPGMTQEQLQSVFTRQAFGGAPDENSMQQGSTGLGLSLVKALVESHKGTVYARSQPWKETVVGVSLPIYRTTKIDLLSENRMGSSEASDLVSVVDGFSPFKTAGMKSKVVGQEFCTHSPSNNEVTSCEGFVPVHPNKIEILSVDDDHMNHLVLGNMLTPKNYAVLKALSGEQALALLNQRFETGGLQALPPIILMDVMMPDMDGYETVLRIRRTFPTADISIIMISAKATEESIHRGFQSGCNDYIIKPVKRLDLLSRIQREWSMIRGRQQHGSKHTVDQTPEPAPQLEGSPVGCLVVISARIVDFPSLAETLTELQLVCVLDQLYKKLEKLRKNGNLTAISWTGNFYTVGIYSNGDEHDEEMQVENALIYASKLVQIGASVPSPLRLRLAVAVHASDGFSHYNVSSGSEAFSTGTALQEAVETLGYPDCVCVGQEVHALAAGAPTPWQFVPLPVVEAERELWLLEAGDWVRAQEFAKAGLRGITPLPPPQDPIPVWETMRSIAMCSVTNTPGLLELMSLQEHVGILQEHEINVCLLSHLPDEELRLIGISKVLHRKKLKAGATLCCLTSSS